MNIKLFYCCNCERLLCTDLTCNYTQVVTCSHCKIANRVRVDMDGTAYAMLTIPPKQYSTAQVQ